MIVRLFVCVVLSAAAFGVGGTVRAADDVPTFKPENTPENLTAFFELLHRTIHIRKNAKQAVALFQPLIPDEPRAKVALKEDISPDVFRSIVEQHKKMVVSEADVGKLAKPEQSVVKVHAATTEELAKYEKGSVAFNQFPGGAKRIAEQALRPGVVFYEVEFLEPGKDAGIAYHLFYWDGKQWTMLGPMWRLVR